MWISILNYATGQIEIANLDKYEKEHKHITEPDYIALNWISDNDIRLCDVYYMITDDTPNVYNHNTQTNLDIPL